jgi:intracellular sulfur oxidation DsrE/DsrF family protein
MKQKYFLLITLLTLCINGFSQSAGLAVTLDKKTQDSINAAKRDSIRWAKMEANATFPWFKTGTWSGVLPVEGVDFTPDPQKQYNLVFDFTHFNKDTSNKSINDGLTEIARIINLHVAAGIPKDHIHPVIVSHAKALFSIFNNDAYLKKYKKDNPNTKIVNDMMAAGIKFIACGQAMNFLDIKKEQLYPGVKVAVSAKTTVSYFVQQGYMLYDIDELE